MFSPKTNYTSNFQDVIGEIRKPFFAGTFYPQNSTELKATIKSLLDQAPTVPAEGKLKILFVPHAGIEFSGRTASWGFKQIYQQDYSKIFLLGISHRRFFDYSAVYSEGIWETPLGKVPIETGLAKRIIEEKEKIIADNEAHKEEHSLEIELIFLQSVLRNFRIVPVLIGQVEDQHFNKLAQKIAENLDEETLLVVSSDLSHYPSYEIANELDNQIIEAILTGKTSEFENTIKKINNASYSGLDTCACGEKAIMVALQVAEILNINEFKKIKYENSGDVSGEKERVVGYTAIGAYKKKSETVIFPDQEAQNEALTIARTTLEEHLSGSPNSLKTPKSSLLLKPLGAFVTLRKNGDLRGCIGEFEPKEPLFKVIQKMAIASATEDPRFPPVSFEELKEIKIEISVMTPRKKISDWRKIKLGKEGVIIESGFHSGTFLPQVATETGWNKEEFLSQLCRQKAGLPSGCYKDPKNNLYTFEVQIIEEK